MGIETTVDLFGHLTCHLRPELVQHPLHRPGVQPAGDAAEPGGGGSGGRSVAPCHDPDPSGAGGVGRLYGAAVCHQLPRQRGRGEHRVPGRCWSCCSRRRRRSTARPMGCSSRRWSIWRRWRSCLWPICCEWKKTRKKQSEKTGLLSPCVQARSARSLFNSVIKVLMSLNWRYTEAKRT